jgi:hypothetical protein
VRGKREPIGPLPWWGGHWPGQRRRQCAQSGIHKQEQNRKSTLRGLGRSYRPWGPLQRFLQFSKFKLDILVSAIIIKILSSGSQNLAKKQTKHWKKFP